MKIITPFDIYKQFEERTDDSSDLPQLIRIFKIPKKTYSLKFEYVIKGSSEFRDAFTDHEWERGGTQMYDCTGCTADVFKKSRKVSVIEQGMYWIITVIDTWHLDL